MKSILILDDDKAQLQYLSNILKSDFIVLAVSNPIAAHKICSEEQFDAIIVDVHMPIINGFEFIKTLKSHLNYETALFILSSDTSTLTKSLALDLGIKEFLSPNMLQSDLILKIKYHTDAKIKPADSTNKIRTFKALQIDNQNNQATLYGKDIELSSIDFKILSILTNSAGKIISREILKETIWPGIIVLDHTLDTHLSSLKIQLANSNIEILLVDNEGVLLI